MKRLLLFACLFTAFLADAAPFEFQDGDRVVLLGDTLIEREQTFGHVESRLTARFPARHVIFRNLGWSADTLKGQSRVSFDWIKGEGEWFRQLQEQIKTVKPTVVILGYGMAHSFNGQAGLDSFKDQYNDLMDAIEKLSGPQKIRFICLSPLKHEFMGSPLPDPAKHNQDLAAYSAVIRDIAKARGAVFISLFEQMPINDKAKAKRPLTDNGIHLTDAGYRQLAEVIEKGLGWEPKDLEKGSQAAQAKALRETIIKKNELFFHRWRPQNETYLFGFRQHEQGQNAREIPMFDPLVEAEEKKIAGLRDLSKKAVLPPSKQKDSFISSKADPQPLPQFTLDPQLEITLWAANPMLAKPIHMNFDNLGRLWVASSAVYPQIAPGQSADDQIVILEDTDNDGKADKSTVFADGLLIPTGVEPGDGGAYVAQSTELLHFKDTNGDGKADEKRIMLSGFGTEDTHHILHSLRWGHDGQLYMNQSIYIHTHTETPHGVVRLNSGGILNLRPPTMELGILMKGLVNTWGHHFDEYGQSFATDGAGGAGINYVVPGAMYVTYAGARRILGSVSPGNYPKFCGLEVVQSPHFPDDWRDNLITCDFRAHRIVRFGINEQASAFVTSEKPDVVRTTDVTFRPVDVKVGPDGALYVADWSNPIIQHGEVDFRDPRRDHIHGRIWRISAKGRAPLPKQDLSKAKTSVLLDEVLSPNGYNQQRARRILTEKGAAILPDLQKWTAQQTSEKSLLEALWLFQSIDKVEPKLLVKLLHAQDGKIRAAATRVLSFWHPRIPEASDLLAARVADEHPRVRMEAIRALSKIPTARSAELVLSVLNKPMDGHLDYAVWLSINDLAEPWIRAIQSGAWKSDGKENQLEFGLKAIEPQLASAALATVLQNRDLGNGQGPWIDLIGQAGGPKELRKLYEGIVKKSFEGPAMAKALNALSQAARVRGVRPEGNLQGISEVFSTGTESVRMEAVKLAGAWKQRSFIGNLLQLASTSGEPIPVRQAAFESLREIGGGEVVQGLRPLAEPGKEKFVRHQAAFALTVLDQAQSMPLVVGVLKDAETEAEALGIWRSILSVKGASGSLTRALPKTDLPKLMTSTGFRVAREGGRNEPELILALSSAGDLDASNADLTPAELQQLAQQAREKGDPARGEQIYRRQELGCVLCHSIGGAGGKVGPDMTSIGASAPVDYLVEAVLFPNRKIKEGYHALAIETKDGQEMSGVLIRETAEQIFLRNAANQEVAVSTKDIASRNVSKGSLMPSGLVDGLTAQERLDLFRFLSELGKPGPYDASKGNVARVWKIYNTSIAYEQDPDAVNNIKSGKIGPVRGTGYWAKDWEMLLGTVDGRLLKQNIENHLAPHRQHTINIYTSARIQVPNAGPVAFKVSGADNLVAWVDGKPVESKGAFQLELPQGTHTLVFKIDPKQLPDSLRVEADRGTFLLE